MGWRPFRSVGESIFSLLNVNQKERNKKRKRKKRRRLPNM
jgi:hypothetical protein